MIRHFLVLVLLGMAGLEPSVATATWTAFNDHLYVPYGRPFSLTFGFEIGAAQFQWYEDGNPLPGQGSSTIWFPSASTTNAGAYYVQASNSSGTTNSPPATVTVTPDFDGPGNVYLVIGSDTAIWNYPSNAPTTVDAYTRHPYYSQNSLTDPSQPSFQVMDPALRNHFQDSYGQPIKFTWWMMGGNIYRDAANLNVPVANTMTLHLMKQYHGAAIAQFGDELSLHYHTFFWSDVNLDGEFYWNQPCDFDACRADFDVTLAQYLLEEDVYPVSFRSGWHFMDNHWQAYLNQLIPYCMHNDYGAYKGCYTNPEPVAGIEDWSRATSSFVPFHPATDDYQVPGNGPGWNTRSIKMQNLTQATMDQVFAQAAAGTDQLMCIWDHLPENFLFYLTNTVSLIQTASSNYPAVPFRYCTAVEGMQRWRGVTGQTPLVLNVSEGTVGQTVTLAIQTSAPLFQPQPFVCLRDAFQLYSNVTSLCTPAGTNSWTITLPVPRNQLAKVGIAATDQAGNLATSIIRYLPDDLYIDNLDPQYAEVQGNWISTNNAAWGTNARIALLTAVDTAQARWSLPVSRSGRYSIAVQVPAIANAASNVQFTVYSGGSNICSAFFPSAIPANQWVSLGTPLLYQTLSNVLEMAVSGADQAGTYAVADVVRLVPLADTNAPTITCSSNIVVTCAGPSGATVSFAVTATDTDDPRPTVVCQPSSGALFPPGTTTVTCTATDSSGNTSSCAFTVTVQTAPSPVITFLTNAIVPADASCQAAMPDLTGPDYIRAESSCSSVTVTQSVPVNTALPLGLHTVVLGAFDADGNVTYATNSVLVRDGAPPLITRQPQSQTNLLGGAAAFSVHATSCGDISYQWSLGTNALAGETNDTLTIPNVQLSDAGDYSVLLANSAGSVTSAVAVLTVHSPPVALAWGAATTVNQPLRLTPDQFFSKVSNPDGGPLALTVTATSNTLGFVSMKKHQRDLCTAAQLCGHRLLCICGHRRLGRDGFRGSSDPRGHRQLADATTAPHHGHHQWLPAPFRRRGWRHLSNRAFP